MVNRAIKQLVLYGVEHQLLEKQDEIYTTNKILEVMELEDFEDPGDVAPIQSADDLEKVLKILLDDATARGVIKEDSIVLRDLFDTKLMNTLLPRPSEVIAKFYEKYERSPREATEFYYDFSRASDYIRTYRVAKDQKWVTSTEYGDLDITINLSKPEKDPKMIALAKNMSSSTYPKCLLCKENEGYAGRINHPARQNHRIIPITIQGKEWGLQYSPYVYYNEHCIVFCGEHTPMKMCKDTFAKLFDFVTLFPHYFLGSNADLPIVGGSILSHDHYQGGNYEFAMAKADILKKIEFRGYEDVEAGIVKWPMSVIRLKSDSAQKLIDLSDKILTAWRAYTDEEAYIYAMTDGETHNTITPIARMRGEKYEIDLVLRNNITTEEHPLGLYHPWEEYHHIKKENIGLIEVMGLAVLPARLKDEMAALKNAILDNLDLAKDEMLAKHKPWVDAFLPKYEKIDVSNIDHILQEEIGIVYGEILACAGVYKCNPEGQRAFLRFVNYVNEL